MFEAWADDGEIDRLEGLIGRFQMGEVSEEEFQRERLLMGIYAQRQPGKFMIRVRIPFGVLSSWQLEGLARAAAAAGGAGHVTTRQNIQFYNLPLGELMTALRQFAQVGLTTREASGNSVRNITACHLSGVCPKEVFDVTPYAQAVSRYFLRHPATQNLPRKIKMAFSGCLKDCGFAAIHDIGIIAEEPRENGPAGLGERPRRGFRILAGGGLGAVPRPAEILEPFTPADKLLPTMEAILRVFDKKGNRDDRRAARLKFLVKNAGMETFREWVFAEREGLKSKAYPEIKEEVAAGFSLRTHPEGCGYQPEGSDPDFLRWRSTNTEPVKRSHTSLLKNPKGFVAVQVSLPLGDITAEQMRALAGISRRYNGRLRTTNGQDFLLQSIPEEFLSFIHQDLKEAGLARPCYGRACDITCCPGAATCPSGITAPRALGKELLRFFQKEGKDIASRLRDFHIRMTGCPNSCGHHHIGSIGLTGGVLRQDGREIPTYTLLVGGRAEKGRADFGQYIGRFPARRVPRLIERLLSWFQANRRPSEDFRTFLHRVGIERAKEELKEFSEIPSYEKDPDLYKDWEGSKDFKVEINPSEC